MAMTKTKTTKLAGLVAKLKHEQTEAGDGSTGAMPGLVGDIETILQSEGMEADLVPWTPPKDKQGEKALIRTWQDADGKAVAECKSVSLIYCRCESAIIAGESLLPKKEEKKRGPGRPPKDKQKDTE